MTARIDHGITYGTIILDGAPYQLDNNVWVVGDDEECIVIDAPHDVDGIMAVVGERRVVAIVCTHAHGDHVAVAPALRERTGAPILVHPAERELWAASNPDTGWDRDLADGDVLAIAGTDLHVLHTPGHTFGAVCLYVPAMGCVFTGDTLFEGGPGATGRPFSDRATIEKSIRDKLFTLPAKTVVHTGHGPDTTIGAEAALEARGGW
jgi:glyoxylase-like metal-dependent hydrolase (beta-lactamase superfamily II)